MSFNMALSRAKTFVGEKETPALQARKGVTSSLHVLGKEVIS